MQNKIFYTTLLLLTLLGTYYAQNQVIAFNNPDIYYEGRITYNDSAAVLSWPGTSANICFKGTGISAIMQDADTANYYNVILDNKVISKIHTDTIKQNYFLASGLAEGKHKIELFKRTGWGKGKTFFYGFETSANTVILTPPPAPKRKIEFFGNSITCGYAMEDNSGGDSWFGYFENNYLSYAAITARHFNARYYSTSKSGIGIMVSWFPLIMPEMYDRLDPTVSTSRWDFAKFTPDIVVINLFQNDSWIVNLPDNEQFKYRFGTKAPDENFIIKSYKDFVATIRNKYLDASIICALGNMNATKEGSPWPVYVQKAVDQLNDPKIYTLFFKYKNTDGHPKVDEQQAMADSLIAFIEKNIDW
jgi:hypothetical protein